MQGQFVRVRRNFFLAFGWRAVAGPRSPIEISPDFAKTYTTFTKNGMKSAIWWMRGHRTPSYLLGLEFSHA